jgi:hypothetical protein
MDLACHLELSELRTSNHATNVGGCVGLISCANAGTCTATIAGSVHNPTVATVRYQDKPRHTQRPRTRKSVSIEQRV